MKDRLSRAWATSVGLEITNWLTEALTLAWVTTPVDGLIICGAPTGVTT